MQGHSTKSNSPILDQSLFSREKPLHASVYPNPSQRATMFPPYTYLARLYFFLQELDQKLVYSLGHVQLPTCRNYSCTFPNWMKVPVLRDKLNWSDQVVYKTQCLLAFLKRTISWFSMSPLPIVTLFLHHRVIVCVWYQWS